MKHTLSTLALGALAGLLPAASVHAAEPWAATATQVVPPEAVAAVRRAPMQAGEPVRVAVALRVHDRAGLDARVAALAAGRSHARLTPAEFLARHAPTPAEADAVAAHLRAAGFTDVRVAQNRMLVTARGTAAAARTAFDTELVHFDVDGRDAHANTTPAKVPARLGGIVHAVLGLQTIAQGHAMNRRAPLDAAAPAAASKGIAMVHEAPDFSTIYGADKLPPATNSSIAIFTLGDVTQVVADMKSFTAARGYPDVDLQVIPTSAASGDLSGVVEWDMDTQASLAAAGGQVKEMLLYVGTDFSDDSVAAEFNAFVADDRAQTFNNSWGGCELAFQASGLEAAMEVTFEIAVAQGQTFAVSSGDSGSYQCGTKLGGQSWPAVSPWVMAVGGTTLYTKNSKPSAYAHEETWGCSGASDCFDLGGTGGGMSATEPVPSWQRGIVGRKGKGTTRGIPDVAFDADPQSGLDLMFYGSFDPLYPIGGTSLSAPIFTGLWTRLQSLHGNTLFFPAMALYGMHDSDAVIFHDVTAGSNGGYAAAVGWDATTGFGSFDAGKFNDFIDANPGAFGGQ